MATFEDIQQEIRNVMDYIDTLSDEETTDEQRQSIDAYLAELGTAEADKVDGFGFIIRALNDSAANARDLAAHFIAKAKSREAAADRLKNYYLQSMQRHGLNKVKGDAFSISRSSRCSVRIDNLNDIPSEYVTTETVITPNKRLISDAIKAGNNIPGARLENREFISIR